MAVTDESWFIEVTRFIQGETTEDQRAIVRRWADNAEQTPITSKQGVYLCGLVLGLLDHIELLREAIQRAEPEEGER